MRIKPEQITIDDSSPFNNDVLNREESAEILTQFVENVDGSYVIAIDSAWGTGKTTFLLMWQAYLKTKKINSVYYNAWEADFSDDALVSLIKEIELCIDNIDLDPKKRIEANKFLRKTKEISYSIVKKGIPTVIKIATHGLIDASSITEDAISRIGYDIAKEQFESYETSKQSLKKFKNNLEKFSEQVSDKAPLIIMIDELDRCRPDYAIQVLEKIKHLFSIKNIIFVLGIDKKQIGFSIATLYGNKMDVEGYLARFIDFDYTLTAPDKKAFINHTISRHKLDDYFEERKKYKEFQQDKDSIVLSLVELLEIFDFSLRDIEQIISQITIVIKVTPKNNYIHPIFLCFLLVIRRKQPELYSNIRKLKFSPNVIVDNLKLSTKLTNYHVRLIRAYLEVSLEHIEGAKEDPKIQYSNIVADDKSTQNQKEDAESMISIILSLQNTFRTTNIIEFLVNKIEISTRFK